MSKRLLNIYRNILAVARLEATDDGFVSTAFEANNKKPVQVKGKRLVLPTKEQRQNADMSERVFFHPLSENVVDTSDNAVLEFFRTAIIRSINYTVGTLGLELLTLAASTAQHAKLTPDQSEFLSHVKDADEKTIDVFLKLVGKMPVSQSQRQFVSIYLKRGGVLNGAKHMRVAVVTFPLYEELKKGGDMIYDVKMPSKKVVKTLIGLLEYIFPALATEHQYSAFSDSKQAPFLDALMKATRNIAAAVNDTVSMFRKRLDEPEKLEFNSEWVEEFENIDALALEARSIPNLTNPADVKTAEVAQPSVAAATVAAASASAQSTYPWMQQQPGYGGFAQPQPMPTHSGVVKTQRGTDFESLLRSNPALGGGFSSPQPNTGNWRDAPPSWGQQPGWGGGGGWGGGNMGYPGGRPGF